MGWYEDIFGKNKSTVTDSALRNPYSFEYADKQTGLNEIGSIDAGKADLGLDTGGGNFFTDNKDAIGAGIGIGQLGLGMLNYSANKKGLESDLASAQQARELAKARADNKIGMQDKFQKAWSA